MRLVTAREDREMIDGYTSKVRELNHAIEEAQRFQRLYSDLRKRVEELGVQPYKGLLEKHDAQMGLFMVDTH